MRLLPTLAALVLALPPATAAVAASRQAAETPFDRALATAERALEGGDLDRAREAIRRAQERDAKSPAAWALRARWAEAAGDRGELAYSLHRQYALLAAQGAPRAVRDELRARLEAVDPAAGEVLGLAARFVAELLPLAESYEEEGRPHSAIRVHREILALDPERAESVAAIERIASAPDPSLAEHAKPKDLLADVSEEWIAEFDAEHATWKDRATLQREHYTTYTNAGYAVLVRCAEAMEQMNAFYRQFFRYGTEEDGRSVPRIDLVIFRTRDEYLKHGSSPVEWSAGQFTGASVETFIGDGGFEGTVGTLFHEAAHQFVSLATNAAGWLNEGLASFFEGCRILANGTVLMNLPANHRLFPLVERMERGWMSDAWDGIDRENPSGSHPSRAPTFRIVLENEYPWGPPWYAPTWGVVYFLYNYQDPADGRFVYRDAFLDFVDASGGRVGEGAVENFEEVVLGNPAPPTPGVEGTGVALPRTVDELDPVWKEWLVRLRDEQSGRLEVERPYHQWALHAITRGDHLDAKEHFEKGLVATPEDVGLLLDFAALLAERLDEPDRAVRLLHDALRIAEAREEPDEERIDGIERRLVELDPGRKTIERVRRDLELAAEALVKRYVAEGLDLVAMDLAWRLGTDLGMPSLFAHFEEAARRSGKSLAIWKLAYDEHGLDGWNAQANEGVFQPQEEILAATFGAYEPEKFDYRFLTLDEVTSGDFSMEAEIRARRGEIAFAGLVFGQKSLTDFHAAILYPPGVEQGQARPGFVDLTSFYGDSSFDVWRHNPVPAPEDPNATTSERWYRLRVDVTGRLVDVWLDDEYVATQEFQSLDVLRGKFGIVVGPGECAFRNVRYLARPRLDPGAEIERTIRLERLGGEGARGASWLGKVPPFPDVLRWAQGSRTSWAERGAVPQLLVLCDVDQDLAIPVGPWLQHLADEYADVGLEIVSVFNRWHDERLDEHLAAHPRPGAVAVDRVEGDAGLGETFGDYFVDRFGLPRLVLLDVTQEVVWEGDPGFKIGVPWSAGDESYLDGPLAELVERSQLREVAAWRERWPDAVAALRAGDLAAALPVLLEAQSYGWRLGEDVLDAQTKLAALRAACESLPDTVEEIRAAGATPAALALVEWAGVLEIDVPLAPRERRALEKDDACKGWERVLGARKPALRSVESGKDVEPDDRDRLIARCEETGGPLPLLLAERLRAAGDDPAALREALLSAERLPAEWLARERFGW